MIGAVFTAQGGNLTGFTVSGHAGYADAGSDIVCAAVSSAVQLTANAVTDVVKAQAEVAVKGSRVSLCMKETNPKAELFLQALKLHLKELSCRYPGTIQVKVMEVK